MAARLERLAYNALIYHIQMQMQTPLLPPSNGTLVILQKMLEKGMDPAAQDGRDAVFYSRCTSLFDFAAKMYWRNVCTLFIQHGVDPTPYFDVFGRGIDRFIGPLPDEECRVQCDQMRQEYALHLLQKKRDALWSRRRDAAMCFAMLGYLQDNNRRFVPEDFNYSAAISPIPRASKEENLSYLHDGVFSNLCRYILTFL